MLKKILRSFQWERVADKRGPKRIVVYFISGCGTRAVVASRINDESIEVEDLISLPPIDLSDEGYTQLDKLREDYDLNEVYASIIFQSEHEHCRNMQFPKNEVQTSEQLDERVREMFGVDNDYAVIAYPLPGKKGAALENLLALTFEYPKINSLVKLATNANYKPVTLNLSSPIAINCLITNIPASDLCRAYLCISDEASTFVVLDANNSQPILIRHFPNGFMNIIEAIMKGFGFDSEMALDTFLNNTCDFSYCLKTFSTWFHQLNISIDYVERRLSRSIKSLTMVGSGSASKTLRDCIGKAVNKRVNHLSAQEVFGNSVSFVDVDENESIDAFLLAIAEAKQVLLGGCK